MRSAAATVAERGADLIDLNMGCPVPKVLQDRRRRRAHQGPRHRRRGGARRARGQRAAGHRQAALGPAPGGDRRLRRSPTASSTRPASARSASTRAAPAVHHKGTPDYDLAARLVQSLDAPVILTGGLRRPRGRARRLRAHRGRRRHARPRLAGQPVAVRAACSARRAGEPTRDEVLAELRWVMDRAVEHLGADRAGALPAQVLPLVPGPHRTPPRRCSRPCSRRPTWPRRGRSSAASDDLLAAAA